MSKRQKQGSRPDGPTIDAKMYWRHHTYEDWIHIRATSSINSKEMHRRTMHMHRLYEPRHDKTNKNSVRPAKTQISLGIRPVWSESSLSTWRNLGPLATHWAYTEDSDQTERMPRLIWVFAERTLILMVLPCRGSYEAFWTTTSTSDPKHAHEKGVRASWKWALWSIF